MGMAFLGVAYGASCAFILPFAHQCNLMIMGPGGYKTKDFVKVGKWPVDRYGGDGGRSSIALGCFRR